MKVSEILTHAAACAVALSVMAPLPLHAATITFGPITESPDGAVEVDKDGNQKVTTAGRTIGVIAEAAAVNESSALADKDDLAAVFGGALTGDVIGALAGLGSLLASIGRNDASATVSPTYQLSVSANRPIIKDVDFIVEGVFITQEVEGVIFTDTTFANAAGEITFGGKRATVDINPAADEGNTEQPTGTLFSGTAHIDLDAPVSAALFSFTSVLNAYESGGPRDSFSAATITRWEATISVVPLPAPGLMLLSGFAVLLALGRRRTV